MTGMTGNTMQDGSRSREMDGWMEVLTEGHAGSGAGEDEDEHGDELGDGSLGSVRVRQLARSAHGDPAHRHYICYGLRKSSSTCTRPVCGLLGEMMSCVVLPVHPLANSVAAIYIATPGTRDRDWRLAVRGPTKDGMEWDAIQADAGSKIGGSGRINCRWRHARPLSIRTK